MSEENDNHIEIRGAAEGPPLHHIASRVLGRPLLMHPTKMEIVLQVLDGRMGGVSQSSSLPADASRFIGTRAKPNGGYGLNRSIDGVEFISIVGSLVNRGAWIESNSGLVSYEGISAQVRDAMGNDAVHTVVLDLDTPGGEATGMFAAAQLIRELAAEKRVIAVVNDLAASAGYGLASAADEIVVSPTSIVGSIGVVMTHVDASKKLAQDGYSVTQIFSGDHKVDGNPFGPLPDAVKADLQTECQYFYSLFVGMVAAGRGERLTEEMARATQARTFIGEEAVKRGLADRVASLDEVMAELKPKGANSARQSKGDFVMTKSNGVPEAETTGITQEAHTAAVDAARAEGVAAGATAERERLSAIMTSDEAKDRPSQAMAFALDTDLSAEKVTALLGKSPKEASGGGGYQSIEQRAETEDEIGASSKPLTTKTEVADGIWADAKKQAGVKN